MNAAIRAAQARAAQAAAMASRAQQAPRPALVNVGRHSLPNNLAVVPQDIVVPQAPTIVQAMPAEAPAAVGGLAPSIFDEQPWPRRGKNSGHQFLGPAQRKYLLQNWAASVDAFSTTLVFGVRLRHPPTANDDRTDAFCRIFFGTASNQLQEDDCQQVDVDLCDGMAITVLGNCMLSVIAIYGALTFPAPDAVQPELVIDLSIAHGMNCQNARRTVKFGTIAANSLSGTFPIPNFAREAILVNADGTVPSLRLDQFPSDQSLTILSTDFVTKKPDQAVQVADGAGAFAVSTGATASPRTAVIWRLNL
jgi:hypothetical protein